MTNNPQPNSILGNQTTLLSDDLVREILAKSQHVTALYHYLANRGVSIWEMHGLFRVRIVSGEHRSTTDLIKTESFGEAVQLAFRLIDNDLVPLSHDK